MVALSKKVADTSLEIIKKYEDKKKHANKKHINCTRLEWERLLLKMIIDQGGYPDFYYKHVSRILMIDSRYDKPTSH